MYEVIKCVTKNKCKNFIMLDIYIRSFVGGAEKLSNSTFSQLFHCDFCKQVGLV